MKRTITILIIILIGLFLLNGCAQEKQIQEIEEQEDIGDIEQEKPITKDSEDFLPTIDDFGEEWELGMDEAKEISSFSEEGRRLAETRGFVKGYLREFIRTTEDPDEYMILSYAIALYSKKGANDVLDDLEEYYIKIEDLEIGERSMLAEQIIILDGAQYKSYCIDFIKNNVIVEVCCNSPDMESCLSIIKEKAVEVSDKI